MGKVGAMVEGRELAELGLGSLGLRWQLKSVEAISNYHQVAGWWVVDSGWVSHASFSPKLIRNPILKSPAG